MKKSLILLGMLSIGYAYAQEGNVGINTENPKATLEVLPNSANLTKTTNEGIIAPKLTKARIAGIADANLVEGTLVYATDNTYTGTNAKVSKITEKGYYFYNGTEWVKVQYKDTDTNDAEWVYDDTTKRINLKRSGQNTGFENKVYYNSNTGNYLNLLYDTYKWYNPNTNTYLNNLDQTKGGFHTIQTSSSKIEKSTADDAKILNIGSLIVRETSPISYVSGLQSSMTLEEENTGKITSATGGSIGLTKLDNTTTAGIIGFHGGVTIHKGTASNYIIGGETFVSANTEQSVPQIIGSQGGINIYNRQGHIVNAYGTRGRITFNPNNNIGNISGVASNFVFPSSQSPTIQNLYAFSYKPDRISPDRHPNENLGNVEQFYGLYLDDISGAKSNFAIYSNAGKVRVGDLADTSATTDRTVVVDKDGVLKVGTATASTPAPAVAIGSTSSMECNVSNRGKMNFIQGTDGKSDVFGICMKNADGNYYWGYMVGGNNPTNGTGAFGSGL